MGSLVTTEKNAQDEEEEDPLRHDYLKRVEAQRNEADKKSASPLEKFAYVWKNNTPKKWLKHE